MQRASWFPLVLILLVAAAIYAPVSQAYFLGYDDFWVVHRTAFQDTSHPSEMITTSHFGSAKYRPMARVLDYLVYHLSSGQPWGFRYRNIASHLGTAAMLYLLGLYLFKSRSVGLSAALLFALHPLANQSIVASSWTITPAAFILLASFVMLIQGSRSAHGYGWLIASLLSLWFSLFVYEAGIIMVGFALIFLVLEQPPRRFVISWLVGLVLVLGMLFTARAIFVKVPTDHSSIAIIAKNLVFYSGALLSAPVDSILAHDLFGIALPSQINFRDASFLLPTAAGLAVLCGLAFLLWRRFRKSDSFPEPAPWLTLFLVGASIPLWLIPFLLFTPHPSETYLYLPAASASLFVAAFLHTTLRSQTTYIAVLAVVAVLFGAAAFNRNRHVIAGAEIAQRIIYGFPLDQWKQGTWDIRVAEADPPVMRYGIYSYQGLATIDPGEPGIRATEYALQVATLNPGISAQLVSPSQMTAAPCQAPLVCYWVYADGRVARTP